MKKEFIIEAHFNRIVSLIEMHVVIISVRMFQTAYNLRSPGTQKKWRCKCRIHNFCTFRNQKAGEHTSWGRMSRYYTVFNCITYAICRCRDREYNCRNCTNCECIRFSRLVDLCGRAGDVQIVKPVNGDYKLMNVFVDIEKHRKRY